MCKSCDLQCVADSSVATFIHSQLLWGYCWHDATSYCELLVTNSDTLESNTWVRLFTAYIAYIKPIDIFR